MPIEISDIKITVAWTRRKTGAPVLGWASAVIGGLKVYDFIILQGRDGSGRAAPNVALPTRPVMAGCPACHHRNPVRARFCNDCGAAIDIDAAAPLKHNGNSRAEVHTVHPTSQDDDQAIRSAILAAYRAEVAQAGATAGKRGVAC